MFRRVAHLVPPAEQRQLAGRILGRTTAWVFAHEDHRLAAAEAARLTALLRRRAAGEPMAYLLGRREFYGRDFEVTPDVLIPRPETEHLVEAALASTQSAKARVVDVGTGSGCIALTLAAERPDWTVIGSDLSAAALAVAERNRLQLGIDSVRWHRGDLLTGLDGPFDTIVSNPPYVAAGDPHLDRGDLRFEPQTALTDGADGLALIRRLISESRPALAPGGWLWIEHGHDQAAAVREAFEQQGYEALSSHRDLAGIERITGGRRARD
ncbi:peptide chain release factor N(5)-glutamine methyltransferase [Wenzhouxiangella sp. XN79A]|nr:peptide chain release factor N(5)-glutamine methyltransferase [Wenzhouxiangella sp. XN79A]NKI35328.1 peptide chain release factor N(5)-glutamine methyltransferase [Wenzhouxiangella sp. XN79A]